MLPLQWRNARTKNRAVAEVGTGGGASSRPEEEDATDARGKTKPQQGSNATVNFKNGLLSSEWYGRPTIKLGNSVSKEAENEEEPQGFQLAQISKQEWH